MTSARFVLDTNVLVSIALSARSIPGKAILAAYQHGTIIYSDETYREFVATLDKPKLVSRVDGDMHRELLAAFQEGFLRIQPTETITDCRDPKDNKFLELAVAGKAAAIITGDQDLLTLHPFREIQILTPADFLAQYPR